MRIATLVLCALLLASACGKSAPARYHNKGSLEFSIDVPSGWTTVPEKADGDWKDVVFHNPDDSLDVLVNWHPGWSFDDLLQWFNAAQQRLGTVMVLEKADLPNQAGYFILYDRGGIQYAKSVTRCGKEAIHCMATISGSVKPGPEKEQAIAMCKAVSCP